MSDDKNHVDTVHINSREHGAAFCIRGLKEKAYWMVMTAQREADGWYILKGSPKAFDELASDLLEEIEYQISPGLSIRALKSLYKKVSSDGFY
jgi:hypothetical protein